MHIVFENFGGQLLVCALPGFGPDNPYLYLYFCIEKLQIFVGFLLQENNFAVSFISLIVSESGRLDHLTDLSFQMLQPLK